jgi:phosphatidate cytidylyltransferase
MSIITVVALRPDIKFFLFFSLLISVASDIGGLTFGKIFKGKKLSKISPNKTIAGSIGSFIFSLLLIPMLQNSINIPFSSSLILITLLISFTSQLGDLLISYLKRKAKVKDTSDLLPGHGGILDRIDGIIFAIPVGLILFSFI